MALDSHRLRKYRRRKRRSRSLAEFDRLSVLYWRYHRKVHGPVTQVMLYEAHNNQIFN